MKVHLPPQILSCLCLLWLFPNWSWAQTVEEATGSCEVINITVSNIGECDDNGTIDPSDDFFTADVRVDFSNAPGFGFLSLFGDVFALDSTFVASGSPVTFRGLVFSADGGPIALGASFNLSADTSCSLFIPNVGTAPGPCSTQSISLLPATTMVQSILHFFTADVRVDFSNAPGFGFLSLFGDVFALDSTFVASGSPVTFRGLVFSADGGPIALGASFNLSADTSCSLFIPNVGTAPGPCSTQPLCSIDSISLSNVSSCNDNGTIDPSDDFFTADVRVDFSNAPGFGFLSLFGDVFALDSTFVASGSPVTFRGLVFSADGGPIALGASFNLSADTSCSLFIPNVGTAPGPCSTQPLCSIDSISLSNVSSCNDNGTIDPSDDFFTADVRVDFSNAPGFGFLSLFGDVFALDSTFVASGSPVTFRGLVFSADGGPIALGASFNLGADTSCSLFIPNVGTAPGPCSRDLPTAPSDVFAECASDVPPPVNLTAVGNCADSITVSPTIQITPGVCLNDYVEIRTWTFTDTCGNTSSVSQTIRVLDTLAPVVIDTIPPNLYLECIDDVPAPVNLTAVDNCGDSITVSPTSQFNFGSCVNDFTEIRTWTFSDTCGNTSSVSQTITVLDTLAPVIVSDLPQDLNLECVSDIPPPVDLTAEDNCGGQITVSPLQELTFGNCLNDLTLVRTWTFADTCGNVTSYSQTITVLDTLAPVITSELPQDLNLECASDIPPPMDLTAEDNCGGQITVSPRQELTFGNCLNDLTLVRTWTFADTCGNTTSYSQTITVLDTLAPVITSELPQDLNLECASDIPPPMDLTAEDNCGGQITVSPLQELTFGNCLNDLTLVRTWTFADTCGNTTSYSQTITVLDTLAPVITSDLPQDLNLECASDIPPPVDLTAEDNCGGQITVSPLQELTFGNCLNDLTLVRTWTFADTCGNTTSYSQTITVLDTLAPILTELPSDIVVCEGEPVQFTPPSAIDNCDGTVRVFCVRSDGLALSDPYPLGETLITCSAADTCGNTASNSFSVTVNPNAFAGQDTSLVVCDTVTVDLSLLVSEAGGSFEDPGATGGLSGDSFTTDGLPAGIYTLDYIVPGENGCKSDTALITLEVIECCVISNVALGKPTETPCDYGNSYSGLGVDGVLQGSTPWTSNPDIVHICQDHEDDWWQVDLGDGNLAETFEISEICLYNRSSSNSGIVNRLKEYYIFISCNPFDASATVDELLNDLDIYSQFVPDVAGFPSCIQIPDVIGQYVRIQLPGKKPLHFAEVQVFGCPAEGDCGPLPDPCAFLEQPFIDPVEVFPPWDTLINLIATPSGGTWMGPGVDSLGRFNPSIGIGTYAIAYTITDGDCEKTEVIEIEVADPASCTAPTNLALGKAAMQSSTYANGVASIAVDGDIDGSRGPWTNPSIQHTAQGDFQPWWKVDLGQVSDIQSIKLFNRTDCCSGRLKDFYLFVSDYPIDASQSIALLTSDSDISSYYHEGSVGASKSIEWEVQGRYVAIKLTGNKPLHMAEVRVMGCPASAVEPPTGCDEGGDPSNIALGGTAMQSSTYGNGVPELAIDGNLVGDSPWSANLQHTDTEDMPWWMVDLGADADISSVKIYNRSNGFMNRLNNFYVFVSVDPIDVSKSVSELAADPKVASQYFGGAAGSIEEFSFDVAGRYVMIKLSGMGKIHVAEVEVYGCFLNSGLRFVNATEGFEATSTFELEAYPNPFSDRFRVRINGDLTEGARLKLLNALGQTIRDRQVAGNNTYYLGDYLAKGMYLVQLVDGDEVRQIKVVKVK